MKITKFFAATLCVAFGLFAMTSCSSDDDPELSGAYAIEGSYYGDLELTVSGNSLGSLYDMTYTIAATSSGVVAITIPEQSFAQGMVVPEMTVYDVPVSESNGVYTLSETSDSQDIDDVTYEISLKGTVTNGELNLESSLKPGPMPMYINGVFTGNKQ